MLISMNWLEDFVDLSGLDKKELIGRFTLSTAEVEDIIEKGVDTYGVVVARIASIENHPNSKKLHLLKLDVGEDALIDCVCGAPNVREGMRVAFARAGGAVCGHAIGEAVVGGYPSFGMCCSEAELGISADNSGLMEIFEDAPLGTDIKTIYPIDDIVFEVDNKSLTNRPDLWGHFGIAREFSALTDRPLRTPDLADTDKYASLPQVKVSIDEPTLCFRYSSICAENVTRRTSPMSMRIRLFYCGSRAINFQADLTNYVMMELGQPMHAFDRRRVDEICVRRFETPFTFQTLDGVERDIDDKTLMICNGDVPVAVAGIMGGLASEIEDDTTDLLVESACFDAVCVRKSSTRLGLRTDASMRYEKTLDPELTTFAAKRLLYLLLSLDSGARVTSALTDVYPTKYPTITLPLEKAFVDRYTGIDIPLERIEKTLISLGFGVKKQGEDLTVTVPSFRSTKDVTIKADLIEEITRIYGYDNFDIKTAEVAVRPVRKEQIKSDEFLVKDILVLREKLHEVHTYLWSDSAKDKALAIETPENVRLLNAQTPDHAILRRSMIPSLLHLVKENRGFADSYGIFEIGHVICGLNQDGLCDERRTLGIVLCDRTQTEESVFLRARDILCKIFSHMRHEEITFEDDTAPESYAHPKNAYAFFVDGKKMGTLGVLHPAVKEKLDRKCAIAYAELDMEALIALKSKKLPYRAPSKFPSIEIDLSFTADLASLNYAQVKEAVHKAGGENLASLSVFDVYESEEASSITFRLTFSSEERTLSKAELQEPVSAVTAALEALGMTFKAI